MILISKHIDLGQSLFARGLTPQATDVILIEKVLSMDFPLFNLTTEYSGGVATKKIGEFALSMSFLQSDTSLRNSDTIRDFLRRGNREYRYHIVIDVDGFVFSGTFKSEDIDYDFTPSSDGYKASFIVRDALAEFLEYTKSLDSVFNFGGGQELSFEEYMSQWHLDFIGVDFNNKTYRQRLNDNSVVFQQIYYGNTANSTDWTQVTRWESFYEIAKGLGFDFDFVLKYTLEEIYTGNWYSNPLSDLYQVKIFFKSDITDDTAIILTRSKNHKETTIPKNKKYIFLGSRQQVPDPLGVITISRGVLSSTAVIAESDSNDLESGSNLAEPPYFQIDDYTIYWIPGSGGNTEYSREQILDIPLKLYSNPLIEAYGQYIRAGVIAYAHFFVSKENGHFLPLQRYAISQYKRYVNSQAKKGKNLTVYLTDVPNIRLWSRITINDGDGNEDYYVNEIKDLDFINKKVTLSLIQL